MLDPRLPILGHLDFIKEEVFRSFARWLEFALKRQEAVQSEELEQRMIEGDIHNIARDHAFREQLINGLQVQRGLAHLARSGEEKRSAARWCLQPRRDLSERCPTPVGQIRETCPPRVVLP
jgi:hypothetical protein